MKKAPFDLKASKQKKEIFDSQKKKPKRSIDKQITKKDFCFSEKRQKVKIKRNKRIGQKVNPKTFVTILQKWF